MQIVHLRMPSVWELPSPRKMPGCLVLQRLIGILVHVYEYLQVLENRLFSSGLHTLGEPPEPEQMASYLQAYFGRNCQRK